MNTRYKAKYGFRDIKLNQVKLFTGPVADYGKVRTAAFMFAKRLGWKFTLRKSDFGLEILRIK